MLLTFLLSWFLGLEPLHEAGFRGEGMTIAVIDVGFYGIDKDTVNFPPDHIIGCKDFLRNDSSLYTNPKETHGTSVLSTMLTEKDDAGNPLGTAPDAHYLLIRTEDIDFEYAGEMDNLIRAIHYADSMGVDIITISLGYFEFDNPEENFTYEQMNGQSPLSQAATAAARNGKLVVVAAGNEGNKSWHYLSTPSDADSVICVGAASEDSVAAVFSSYGPTADGRQKPEVSAWGVRSIIYSPDNQSFVLANGTSFATPRIAGMAACIWQAMPHLSAMDLREHIIASASLYPHWDPQMGYGIPNASAIWQSTALPDWQPTDDDAPVLYFNLQGMPLDGAPEHGFYIEKRGDAVRKIVRP